MTGIPGFRVATLSRERESRRFSDKSMTTRFRLYGIGAEDQATIGTSMNGGPAAADPAAGVGGDDADNEAGEDDDASAAASTPSSPGSSALPSAASTSASPPGSAPLPPSRSLRSPPRAHPRHEARTTAPSRPLFSDDEGHPDDLTAHVRVSRRPASTCPEPDDLRAWLARDFFPLHIRMYSKSRRKAPIYWQLATSSASYSVWLYLHAFTTDTFYKVQNDYAVPKLIHEERRLESLLKEFGPTPRPAERKTLAAQETFVDELRAFLEEVKRVTPLWNPHLDDGVLINFAPLWRLVPHHKPWQKEVKATWDALCAGEYDWAHLAMHLWPERVVPKCATDRSLAIAHGLEPTFWVEGADKKWKPREAPLQPIDDLVRERTSPAVKAALKSLLEAPTAQGTQKPGRRKGAR